jgi:hypothetical protein
MRDRWGWGTAEEILARRYVGEQRRGCGIE